MPKVTTWRGVYRDENNNPVEVKEDVNVTTEGEFSAPIPEVLVDTLRAELRTRGNQHPYARVNLAERRGARVHLRSSGTHYLFDALGELLRVYSAAEVKEELVLRYIIRGRVSAWRHPDGRLDPNGASSKQNDGGYWVATRSNYHAANPAPSFGVDVAAAVWVRVTSTRGTFRKVEYRIPSRELRQAWLDQGAPFAPGDKLSRYIMRIDGSDVSEMPYTTEAESFFDDALMKVSALAVQFEEFGSTPERVAIAATSGGQLLLSGPSAT